MSVSIDLNTATRIILLYTVNIYTVAANSMFAYLEITTKIGTNAPCNAPVKMAVISSTIAPVQTLKSYFGGNI